jgi:hypothetical protein
MLSSSRNTRHPAFSNRNPDRAITSQVSEEKKLSREELRLWSYQEPPLTAGAPYILTSSQTVQVTSDESKTPSRVLSGPEQEVHVLGPKFALADAQTDVHSVYPAPGHSDYGETLAHVVLSHPTIPWERDVTNGSDQGGNNRTPWMGVLTFTEDELLLTPQAWTDAGYSATDPVTGKERKPSGQGVITLTAGEWKNNASVATALSVDAGKTDGADYKDTDPVATVLLRKEAFQNILPVNASTGSSDLSVFRLMAHVRETHGGFMATTAESDDAQPQFATVVSPRTGVPGTTSPVRVISHLISLEGLANLAIQGTHVCVGLVSLYSWDWMCVPKDEVDFESVMISLGKSVLPLRINLLPAQEAKVSKAAKSTKDDASPTDWLRETMDAGYTLKRSTLLTGETTRALLRGPLIPSLTKRDMIKPFSMDAASLMLCDTKSGLDDVSYSSAWTLGRSMALADTSLTTGLLRLRGHLHAEATKRTKARAAQDKKTQISAASYLEGLNDSVAALVKAHDISRLSARGGHKRWLRNQNDREHHLLPTLCGSECDLEDEYYAQELQHVTRAYFGYAPSDGSDIPERVADSDAVLVRAWALDKFYLASVPLQYLVPDPDMLPRESIRTFCIDSAWLGCLIDGGLSLANHFAQNDDAVRREIKKCINKYLAEVRAEGPGKGTTLQIPKWGFFMRSIAVTAFPDLKVEARLRDDTPEGVREVLYMQVVQDDILLCLFDRVPGQDNFESIRISQPAHQQCFALGRDLSKNSFHMSLRPIPKSSGEIMDAINTQCIADAQGKAEFYDWGSRMVRPGALGKHYVDLMDSLTAEQLKNRDIVHWPGSRDDVPSSIIASQLSRPILQLTLAVTKGAPEEKAGDEDSGPSWTQPGAMLHVAPRPLTAARKADAAAAGGVTTIRPDAKFTRLPVGPVNSDLVKNRNENDVNTENKPSQHPEVMAHGLRDDAIERPDYRPNLIYFPRPRDATCYPAYDPGSESGVISAIGRPLDLVFSLRCTESETDMKNVYPDRLEVRIPVALGSDAYPSNTHKGANALLMIPGTAAAPVLPIVEGLNGSGLWSYHARLVVGGLYVPDKPPKALGMVSLDPVQSVLLVVSITPKFARNKMRDLFFDASFMLRRVTTARPSAQFLDTQFDVCWSQDGGLETVFTKPIRVRNAITVRILGPAIYDSDAKTAIFKFETSPPILTSPSPYEVAVIQGPRVDGNELVAGPLDEHGRGEVSIKRDVLPPWIRLVVRVKGGGVEDRCGPESQALEIPRVPSELLPYSINFFHDGEKLSVRWPVDMNRDYDFEVSFGKAECAAKAKGSDGILHIPIATLDACRGADKRIDMPIQETSTHPNLRGLLVQGSVKMDFPWLMCRKDLDFGSTPLVAHMSDVAFQRLVRIDRNDGATELYYWTPDKKICVVETGRPTLDVVIVKSKTNGIPDCSPSETNGRLDVYNTSAKYPSQHRELDWVGYDGSLNGMERTREKDESWTRVKLQPSKGKPIMGEVGVLASSPALDGGMRWGSSVISWGGYGNTRKWWVGPKGEMRQSAWYRSTDQIWAWEDELALPEGTISLGSHKLQRWDWNTAGHNFIWRKSVGGGLAWGQMGMDDKNFAFTKDAVPDADIGPDSNFCLDNAYRTLPQQGVFSSRGEITLVAWVKRDGSVNLARSYSRDGGDRKWDSFLVAPAGSANLATRLLLITDCLSSGLLFWFDPTGHLMSAKCIKGGDVYTSLESWTYTPIRLANGENPTTDPNGRMNILVTEDVTFGINFRRRDIVWVDLSGRLRSFGFDNTFN